MPGAWPSFHVLWHHWAGPWSSPLDGPLSGSLTQLSQRPERNIGLYTQFKGQDIPGFQRVSSGRCTAAWGPVMDAWVLCTQLNTLEHPRDPCPFMSPLTLLPSFFLLHLLFLLLFHCRYSFPPPPLFSLSLFSVLL